MPHAYLPTLPPRAAWLAVAFTLTLLLGAAPTGFAQGADPLVGQFSDGRLQMSITGGNGQYSGQFVLDGQTYPFMAQGSAARIDGLYQAGGQQYPFIAGFQGETLTVIDGQLTYQLTRQAVGQQGQQAAGPLGQQAAQPPVTQAAPQAGGYLPAGTRLSYRQAVASNPGTNAGPDARATGGQGYIQVDIFHSDAQLCVAKMTMYTAGLTVDTLTQTFSEVIVGEGGLCSTYWAPPQVLAEYQAPPGGIQTVQRGQFDLGGRSYQAVYITSEFETNRITRVYDLASGVLLTEVEGSGQRGYAAGGNPERAGSGVQELINVRQLSMPWSVAEALPANVSGLQTLSYRGEYVTSVPGVYMWDSSLRSDYQLTSKVEQRGANYLVLSNTMVMTMPGTNIQQPPSQSRSLLTAFSGHYLPVAVIPQLAVGQVVDVDPVTGMRTYVERNDANGVVLVNEGKGVRAVSLYDPRTGLMQQTQLEQQSDGQNLLLTQQLAGAQ